MAATLQQELRGATTEWQAKSEAQHSSLRQQLQTRLAGLQVGSCREQTAARYSPVQLAQYEAHRWTLLQDQLAQQEHANAALRDDSLQQARLRQSLQACPSPAAAIVADPLLIRQTTLESWTSPTLSEGLAGHRWTAKGMCAVLWSMRPRQTALLAKPGACRMLPSVRHRCAARCSICCEPGKACYQRTSVQAGAAAEQLAVFSSLSHTSRHHAWGAFWSQCTPDGCQGLAAVVLSSQHDERLQLPGRWHTRSALGPCKDAVAPSAHRTDPAHPPATNKPVIMHQPWMFGR